jgi:hypothetical protein
VKGANELAALAAKVEALQTEVTVLASVLEDLNYGDPTLPGAQGPPSPPAARSRPARSPAPGSPGPPGDDDDAEEEPIVPFFGSLLEFVVEHFGPVYARNTSPTVRWCASWWDHAEAIYRLEALWRTWELYRLEPRLGIASWLRDYLDPQLRELTSPTGPFASCTEDRHSPVKALRSNQPPEDYLVDL